MDERFRVESFLYELPRKNPVVELDIKLDVDQVQYHYLCPTCNPPPSIRFRKLPPDSPNRRNRWMPAPVELRRQTFVEFFGDRDGTAEVESFAFFGQCRHCKTIYAARG